MPKITKGDGPSIAGVTPPVPTEDEYVAAMGRHGTDKWTDEDADVQVRWDAERARLLAAVDPHAPVPLLFDLPAVPATPVVDEAPVNQDDTDSESDDSDKPDVSTARVSSSSRSTSTRKPSK